MLNTKIILCALMMDKPGHEKKALKSFLINDVELAEHLAHVPYTISRLTIEIENKLKGKENVIVNAEYIKQNVLSDTVIACKSWNKLCNWMQNNLDKNVEIQHLQNIRQRLVDVNLEVSTCWNAGEPPRNLPSYALSSNDAYEYVNAIALNAINTKLPPPSCSVTGYIHQLMNTDRPFKTLLLHGVSGTGKTTAAKIIASELMGNIITPTAASLISKYHGETHKQIERLFHGSKELSNKSKKWTVIFLDEIDSILSDRSKANREDSRVVNTMLLCMDDINVCEERVVLIGVTNYINKIDKAALQRFSVVSELKPPSSEQLFTHLKFHVDKELLKIDDNELKTCVEYAYGLDGRSISNAVKAVAANPIELINADTLCEKLSESHSAASTSVFYTSGGFEIELKYDNWEAHLASGTASQVFSAFGVSWMLYFTIIPIKDSPSHAGKIVFKKLGNKYNEHTKEGVRVELRYRSTNGQTDNVIPSKVCGWPTTGDCDDIIIDLTDLIYEHRPGTRDFRDQHIDEQGTFMCNIKVLSRPLFQPTN